jgi:hypothetical protein
VVEHHAHLQGSPHSSLTQRALDWLSLHLDCFDPFPDGRTIDESRVKAIDELALLGMYLWRHSAFTGDPRVRSLLEFVLNTWSNPLFRHRIHRIRGAFIPYALPGIVLWRCGLLRDKQEWGTLQECISRNNVTLPERPPHRVLELRFLLDLGQFQHDLPSYSNLCRNSMLTVPLNPICMSDADVYSLTHILFYLSDFGSLPVSVLSSRRLEYNQWAVERLLGMYLYKKDWDLVAELLLSCHCLGRKDFKLYRMASSALEAAQLSNGMVPGPAFDPAEVEQLQQGTRRIHIFEKCYHTTLVSALTAAQCGRVNAST